MNPQFPLELPCRVLFPPRLNQPVSTNISPDWTYSFSKIRELFLIMAFTLSNKNLRIRYFIDQPVFLIDPAAPIARPVSIKRFRLTNAFKRITFNVAFVCKSWKIIPLMRQGSTTPFPLQPTSKTTLKKLKKEYSNWNKNRLYIASFRTQCRKGSGFSYIEFTARD